MSETVNFEEEISLQLFSLTQLRIQNIVFAQHIDKISPPIYNIKWNEKVTTLMNCGSFVEFEKGKISRANFCRERFCPLCQKRRSLKMYSQILQKINKLEHEYSCIHVVLTIPNCKIEEVYKNFRLLMSNSSKLFNLYKSSWKGVGRFFEVTYNADSDTFHPHLHCIVLVKPSYFKSRYYISFKKLQEDWGRLVDVQDVQVHLSSRGEDKSLIAEVAKYATKPWIASSSDFEFSRLLELFEVLKGKRLVQFYGVLKGLKSDPLDDEEEIEEDDTLALVDSNANTITPFVWNTDLHRYDVLKL